MASVQTVSIGTLCPPADPAAVFDRFDGFVPVLQAEVPLVQAHPIWILRDGPWQQTPNPPPRAVGPLGLHFLRDVTLCGSGYLFTGEVDANPNGLGRAITEPAHTSEVALQWLQNDDFPDNPLTHDIGHRMVLDRPALIVFGAGYPIYGHWLLDFLPRVLIAKQGLGERFGEFAIPLPDDVPDWLYTMLDFFCGVKRDQIVPFNRDRDRLVCARAVVPSFGHDGGYLLHPYVTRFYHDLAPRRDGRPGRRICLSRRNFEQGTRSAWRVFESREAFEAMAVARGYEIVCPEDLDFTAQIHLFAESEYIVGEFGSAVHSAIFSGAGTRIGCFPLNNPIQNHIGAACGHHNIYIDRKRTRTDERGVVFYDIGRHDLESMFEVMETLRVPQAEPA